MLIAQLLVGLLQACDWLAYQYILFCLQAEVAYAEQHRSG